MQTELGVRRIIQESDKQPLCVTPSEESNSFVMWGNNRNVNNEDVKNEEASHYQSGIFMGVKAHVGLEERCGETEENDFVGRSFRNGILHVKGAYEKP